MEERLQTINPPSFMHRAAARGPPARLPSAYQDSRWLWGVRGPPTWVRWGLRDADLGGNRASVSLDLICHLPSSSVTLQRLLASLSLSFLIYKMGEKSTHLTALYKLRELTSGAPLPWPCVQWRCNFNILEERW